MTTKGAFNIIPTMALGHTKTLTLLVAATALSALCAETKDPAALHPLSVEVTGNFCRTGTITQVCPNRNFTLEERNGRHSFLFVEDRFDIREGNVIAVTGEFVQHDDGRVLKVARHVNIIGQSPIPSPKEVTLADLARGDFIYRRVTTEGMLVLARRDEIDASALQLLIKDGAMILNVAFNRGTNRIDEAEIPLGTRLRLTGVILQATGGARQYADKYLAVDGDGGLEVVSPPPADIFAAPALEFDNKKTPHEIVQMDSRRFDGVVLATWGGDQMMLAGRDFRYVKAMLARPNELPVAGDHVTVVGFPDTDLYGIDLIYARCRPTSGLGDFVKQPKPIATTLHQLLTDERGRPRINGYSHGRLLRIRGTVLDVQPSLAVFSLNDDGLTMPVDYSSSPDAASLLEPNAKVETVVLAVVETDHWRESIVLPQTRGIKLVLRSADDLKTLARPPWWTPARLTAVVISLVLLIVMIVVANRIVNRIMMRRKVSERTRLAVELHDSLSQTLTGVALQLAAGHDAVDDDPGTAKSLLETAERMLESSRTELKNCLFDLRNDTVDDPDFTRAIARTLSAFRAEAHISLRLNAARSMMTDSTAHAVLCVIRELVANAVRHGAATRIWIAGVADGTSLRFSVRDNGCGFDPSRSPGPREGHFGLSGIHERLASMNGELSIASAPGKGTKAIVTIV